MDQGLQRSGRNRMAIHKERTEMLCEYDLEKIQNVIFGSSVA